MTAGFIRSYAVFWALGLGFLWWPILLLRAFRARIQGTAVTFCPCRRGLPVAVPAGGGVAGASLSRVFSAGYNVTIWITLAVLTTVPLDPRALVRGVAQLAGIQSVAVLAALGLYPLLDGARLPSSFFLPATLAQDPAFESFTTVRLVVQDYFGGAVLRTAGFFGNPTWAGALAALGVLVSVQLLRGGGMARGFYAGLLVLDLVVLYLSYSRNTWLALGAALLAMAVVTLARRRSGSPSLVTATAGRGALVYVMVSVDLGATFEDYNSVREGSLESRTAIYEVTWGAIRSALPADRQRHQGTDAGPGRQPRHAQWLPGHPVPGRLVGTRGAALAYRSGVAVATGVSARHGQRGVRDLWFVAEDVDAGHLAPLALVMAFALTDYPLRRPVGGKRRSRGAPHSG